jgi:hypothetical protein
MSNSPLTYDDWKDFFIKRLVDTGAFRKANTFSKGDTDIEIYSTQRGNLDTEIQVGYFSPMKLIYIHILNPLTPGKNRQQEIEHLYKYEFDKENRYGPPGLDFNGMNVQGISNYLDQGFNGSETVYYRKGKAIKSIVTTSYYPDSPTSTVIYKFQEESIFKGIFNRLIGRQSRYEETKTINLRDIFGGLNGR